MYRSGGEQARAEAQQKRKQEREGIRTDFLSSSEPPNTWLQANLALLAQATELLESINTCLDSLHSVMAKIELRTDMMARSSGQDRQDRRE